MITGVSKEENQVLEYVKSVYTGAIIQSSRRLIHPYQIDILLEDVNLAIEFNGLFWHSSNHGTDQNYHFRKSEMCRN